MFDASEYFVPEAVARYWISLFAFFESIFQRGDLKAVLVMTEIRDLWQSVARLPLKVLEVLFVIIRPGT